MKRSCAVLALLLVAVLAPRPASADSILDPIIGVRGITPGGSPLITDATPQQFVSCDSIFGESSDLSGSICSPFEITSAFDNGGIFSMDLTFEQDLESIGVDNLTLDDMFNSFGFSSIEVIDPVTVRLSGGSAAGGALACGFVSYSEFDGGSFTPCISGSDAVVYIKAPQLSADHYLTSVTAVNGVPNPVPEPGTLALMGIGVGSLAAGRRRRRAAKTA